MGAIVLYWKELIISNELRNVKLMNPIQYIIVVFGISWSLDKCVSFHLTLRNIPLNTKIPMMGQVLQGESWL